MSKNISKKIFLHAFQQIGLLFIKQIINIPVVIRTHLYLIKILLGIIYLHKKVVKQVVFLIKGVLNIFTMIYVKFTQENNQKQQKKDSPNLCHYICPIILNPNLKDKILIYLEFKKIQKIKLKVSNAKQKKYKKNKILILKLFLLMPNKENSNKMKKNSAC